MLLIEQVLNFKGGELKATIVKDNFYYGEIFINGVMQHKWGGFMSFEVARLFINRRIEAINTVLELPPHNRLKPFINPNQPQKKGKRNARTRHRAK